jgi:hypothetical protein
MAVEEHQIWLCLEERAGLSGRSLHVQQIVTLSGQKVAQQGRKLFMFIRL